MRHVLLVSLVALLISQVAAVVETSIYGLPTHYGNQKIEISSDDVNLLNSFEVELEDPILSSRPAARFDNINFGTTSSSQNLRVRTSGGGKDVSIHKTLPSSYSGQSVVTNTLGVRNGYRAVATPRPRISVTGRSNRVGQVDRGIKVSKALNSNGRLNSVRISSPTSVSANNFIDHSYKVNAPVVSVSKNLGRGTDFRGTVTLDSGLSGRSGRVIDGGRRSGRVLRVGGRSSQIADVGRRSGQLSRGGGTSRQIVSVNRRRLGQAVGVGRRSGQVVNVGGRSGHLFTLGRRYDEVADTLRRPGQVVTLRGRSGQLFDIEDASGELIDLERSRQVLNIGGASGQLSNFGRSGQVITLDAGESGEVIDIGRRSGQVVNIGGRSGQFVDVGRRSGQVITFDRRGGQVGSSRQLLANQRLINRPSVQILASDDSKEYPDHHPKYAYEYEIADDDEGTYSSHKEERDGEVVRGYYTVLDPDGFLRITHYQADNNGYRTRMSRVPIEQARGLRIDTDGSIFSGDDKPISASITYNGGSAPQLQVTKTINGGRF